MRFKILTLAVALSVLAACAPDQKAVDTSASGTSSGFAPPSETGSQSLADILKTQVGDTIYFDYDKSSIKAEAKAILERQSAFATTNAQLTFTVEGHCDERGTREYNLALGERRATADKKALEALGVQGTRLQTISYGKERPAVVGSNEAAYAQNRRAVLVIN